VEAQKRDGVISYGLSSYGYDMRVGTQFKVFKGGPVGGVNDPKNFNPAAFEDVVTETHVIIPAHAYALAQSWNTSAFRGTFSRCARGKSTYARCGIFGEHHAL